MTIAVGVDPSSQRMVAVIGRVGETSNDVVVDAIRLGASKDILERAQAAYEWGRALGTTLLQLADPGEDVIVAIEQPLLGLGGAHATITQSIVHGAVAVGIASRGVPVKQINNKTWKKNVIGNGNANKAMIADWCKDMQFRFYERTASDSGKPDQDALDALCIWLDTCRHVGVLEKLDLKRARVRRARVGGRQ